MRIIIKRQFEYMIAIVVVLLGLIYVDNVVELPAILSAPRVVLGLLVTLFFPGYALQGILFPKIYELESYERYGIAFALSIAMIPPIAMLLDRSPLDLSPVPVVLTESLLVIVLCLVAIYRRSTLSEHRRARIVIGTSLFRWLRQTSGLNRFISAILIVSATVAIVAALATIFVPGPSNYFTEFYLLSNEGLTENYPQRGTVGEPLEVIVGVHNLERARVEYRVEAYDQPTDELLGNTPSFLLEPEEDLELRVRFVPVQPGENRRIEFRLFKDEDTTPYRVIHLWIDIASASGF